MINDPIETLYFYLTTLGPEVVLRAVINIIVRGVKTNPLYQLPGNLWRILLGSAEAASEWWTTVEDYEDFCESV